MQVVTTLAMLIILSNTYLLLLLGNSILKRIGKNGSAILEWLMGIFLTAFATKLIAVAIGSDQWALPPR